MFLNLVLVAIALFLGILVPIFLLFLPAILELKKPSDCGPRMIEEDLPVLLFRSARIVRIVNIEKEEELDGSIFRSMARIIEALPNLEV